MCLHIKLKETIQRKNDINLYEKTNKKKKTLPSIFLEGNKQTPIRNSKVPTRKTTTMITVKASKPPIVNGCGVGGSGGGLGQELSQSAHEQAGVLSYM